MRQLLKKLQETSEIVPLSNIVPKTTYKNNGLSKLIPQLTLQIHSDLKECEKLWNTFVKNETLFESWNFRAQFSDTWGQKKFFITIYKNKNPIGLLPLVYDSKERRFEWFGTEWQEENRFFRKDDKIFPLLFTLMPRPVRCLAIVPSDVPKNFLEKFIPDDSQYFANISHFKTMDEYLSTLNKKHRYNFKRDFRILSENNPEILWIADIGEQLKYFTHVRDLSLKRFGSEKRKNASQFRHENYYLSFVNVIKNQKDYKTKLLVIKIDRQVVAVDLNIMFENIYYQAQGASNLERYSGIGNFICYLEIEDAIRNKFSEANAMMEDNNWKHKYFFSRTLLKLKKVGGR